MGYNHESIGRGRLAESGVGLLFTVAGVFLSPPGWAILLGVGLTLLAHAALDSARMRVRISSIFRSWAIRLSDHPRKTLFVLVAVVFVGPSILWPSAIVGILYRTGRFGEAPDNRMVRCVRAFDYATGECLLVFECAVKYTPVSIGVLHLEFEHYSADLVVRRWYACRGDFTPDPHGDSTGPGHWERDYPPNCYVDVPAPSARVTTDQSFYVGVWDRTPLFVRNCWWQSDGSAERYEVRDGTLQFEFVSGTDMAIPVQGD